MMLYRVHYLAGKERRTDELEASSPAEAAIKFRYTRRQKGGTTAEHVQVLSVSELPHVNELIW